MEGKRASESDGDGMCAAAPDIQRLHRREPRQTRRQTRRPRVADAIIAVERGEMGCSTMDGLPRVCVVVEGKETAGPKRARDD